MDLMQAKAQYYLIVGMGATGLSIARFLRSGEKKFHFYDTRPNPSSAHEIASEFPESQQFFVDISDQYLFGAEEIYLSPGVSREHPTIIKALKKGKSVVGDVELFLREASAPVIGITGSNGKTTVTTMVGLALEKAGFEVAVGGNIGIPALSILRNSVDFYVLELSSFQLESMNNPGLFVACILNVSQDHMDRYHDFDEYVSAKQRIYGGAQQVVYNLDCRATYAEGYGEEDAVGFGFAKKNSRHKQCTYDAGKEILYLGEQELVSRHEIRVKGTHNIYNALALFAVCYAARVELNACRQVLNDFSGLPHRCEFIAQFNDLTFINDSKATNSGATKAAVEGLADEFSGIVLIAGGDAKGADFSDLAKTLRSCVRTMVLIGKDSAIIAEQTGKKVPSHFASSMNEAVSVAIEVALSGELILLSPACASLDMFENFEHRGNAFRHAVENAGGVLC